MIDNKLILSDGDGVLLDWEWAFHVWMQERGYVMREEAKLTYYIHHMYHDLELEDSKRLVRSFNESAAIGFLPPLRDSMYYVRKLYEKHGYRFRIITSMSLDPHAGKLREMNLRKLYGDAIESVICLDCGADKDHILAEYANSGLWWIEDKPKNADVGHELGLKSILLEHGHNMHHKCPYPIVKNWEGIYNIIVSD